MDVETQNETTLSSFMDTINRMREIAGEFTNKLDLNLVSLNVGELSYGNEYFLMNFIFSYERYEYYEAIIDNFADIEINLLNSEDSVSVYDLIKTKDPQARISSPKGINKLKIMIELVNELLLKDLANRIFFWLKTDCPKNNVSKYLFYKKFMYKTLLDIEVASLSGLEERWFQISHKINREFSTLFEEFSFFLWGFALDRIYYRNNKFIIHFVFNRLTGEIKILVQSHINKELIFDFLTTFNNELTYSKADLLPELDKKMTFEELKPLVLLYLPEFLKRDILHQ